MLDESFLAAQVTYAGPDAVGKAIAGFLGNLDGRLSRIWSAPMQGSAPMPPICLPVRPARWGCWIWQPIAGGSRATGATARQRPCGKTETSWRQVRDELLPP